MGYSKRELNTKNILYSAKKLSYHTSIPPHKGHLSTTATSFCPRGGRCGRRFDCNLKQAGLTGSRAKPLHNPPTGCGIGIAFKNSSGRMDLDLQAIWS